jgi:translation initiation factor 6
MERREHVFMTNFNGNPNVGLYGYANDYHCLVGNSVPAKQLDKISSVLQVPIVKTNIAGTSIIGVFCVGNSHCLLLPPISFDDELSSIKKAGIKHQVINTHLTALGNNILCNDHGAIVSQEIEDEAVKEIESALKVKIVKSTIAGLDNVGSLASVNNKFGIISIDATDEEISIIEKHLKIKLTRGTLGMGLPYISSSLILNSKGFIISEYSSGIEIADADQALGYID